MTLETESMGSIPGHDKVFFSVSFFFFFLFLSYFLSLSLSLFLNVYIYIYIYIHPSSAICEAKMDIMAMRRNRGEEGKKYDLITH